MSTHEDMAKLAKYAKQGKVREISMINDNSGEVASTPEESIMNLCNAHFPGFKTIK